MPPMRRGMCGTCGRLGAAREPFRDRQSKQMQILSRKRFHRAQICWPSSLASYPTPQACLFAAGSAHRIRMCDRSTAGWLLVQRDPIKSRPFLGNHPNSLTDPTPDRALTKPSITERSASLVHTGTRLMQNCRLTGFHKKDEKSLTTNTRQ